MNINSDQNSSNGRFPAADFIQPVLNGLEALCVIINRTGDIVLANRAWRQFAVDNGGDADLVSEGNNYLTVCQAEIAGTMSDRKSVADAIQDVLEGRVPSFEIINTCHSPTEKKWYLERITRFYIEGTAFGFVLHENVTRAVMEERERQAASRIESLGILASGIAHDLNNLITVQMSNLELAKLKLNQDHQILPNLNTALASLQQSSQLSDQLLTFAKGGDPVLELLNINSLMSDAINFSLSGSDIKVHVEMPNEMYFLHGDKRQLFQVFSNLIVNAREAMPSGGNLYVNLKLYNEAAGDKVPSSKAIEISIRDEGHGISRDVIDKVFDPFFTTKDFGHGLGLAIVKSIVDKHNGKISIESDAGVGTTFSIQLPIVRTNNTAVQDESRVIESDKLAGSLLILIMDDDVTIQRTLKDMLEFHGHFPIITANGNQAINAYIAQYNQGRPVDLVLMDLTVIGGMGGAEATSHILKFDPQAKVIASSGYTNNSVLAHFEQHGFIDTLPKPYRMDVLVEIINKWTS